jgi:hypothetical protein
VDPGDLGPLLELGLELVDPIARLGDEVGDTLEASFDGDEALLGFLRGAIEVRRGRVGPTRICLRDLADDPVAILVHG